MWTLIALLITLPAALAIWGWISGPRVIHQYTDPEDPGM